MKINLGKVLIGVLALVVLAGDGRGEAVVGEESSMGRDSFDRQLDGPVAGGNPNTVAKLADSDLQTSRQQISVIDSQSPGSGPAGEIAAGHVGSTDADFRVSGNLAKDQQTPPTPAKIVLSQPTPTTPINQPDLEESAPEKFPLRPKRTDDSKISDLMKKLESEQSQNSGLAKPTESKPQPRAPTRIQEDIMQQLTYGRDNIRLACTQPKDSLMTLPMAITPTDYAISAFALMMIGFSYNAFVYLFK